MPLRNVCQQFTPIIISKYYRLKFRLLYYRLFGTQEVRHKYNNTRFSNNNNLNMPKFQSSKYQCYFYANGIKHWNKLPCQIRTAHSKDCFKGKLRLHLSFRCTFIWLFFPLVCFPILIFLFLFCLSVICIVINYLLQFSNEQLNLQCIVNF